MLPTKILSDSEKRRYDELFLESMRQKLADHIDAQYELLDAALSLNPDASEAVYEMAFLKLSYSLYSDSLSRIQGDSLLHLASRLEPSNLSYKETLAIYLANTGKFEEATKLYEDIVEARHSVEDLATLIWLYKQSGDFHGSIRTLERLERLEGKSEQLSLEKFQTYLAMKDSEHAYQAIEDLCKEYPLDLRYRVLMGDLFEQYGYHERALDIYRDVLTAEPENSYAQLSLLAYYKAAGADSLYNDLLRKVVLNPRTQTDAGFEAMRSFAIDHLYKSEDHEKVLSLFKEILARPQQTRDMAELCVSFMVAIDMPTDSIIPMLKLCLEIEPDHSLSRLQLLQIMLQRNDMEESVKICHEGEFFSPGEITYYYYEGIAFFRLGKNQEAIEALQRGTSRISDQTDIELASDIYGLIADIFHEEGQKEEAYASYEKAIVYNQANLLCLNNYAYFLSLDERDLDKAEKMSRQVIEAEPENPTYLDTFAWILFKKKLYTQARIYIDETLKYSEETEENASLYDHAGDIYYFCGERKQALVFWNKALKLTSDETEKKKLKRKVQRRRP